MQTSDTICAISTPPGIGGIGVVRISGPKVAVIAQDLLGGLPQARFATFKAFRDENGNTIDEGIALYFPGPNSFTGEDVLELQAHGGPVILNLIVQRALSLGARPARPGEFSERAFLNDRIDLVQAEAIADLIESGTQAAARAAQRSLEGKFSEHVAALQREITSLRVFVEAAIDFPEEEIDFLAESDVAERLEKVIERLDQLRHNARQGRLLRDGIVVGITGKPNAGKSSLLNALAGSDVAIVTHVPGTTRDVLREQIQIEGIPLHVLDTAGIRSTEDIVEAEGIRRARKALDEADVILDVIDVTDSTANDANEDPRCIKVLNKMDLLDPGHKPEDSGEGTRSALISAKTGEGLDALKALILLAVGATEHPEGSFSARQRHLDALRQVKKHLLDGQAQLLKNNAGELLAEELRLAQRSLGEITGEFTSDDLLGQIFASFCIGK